MYSDLSISPAFTYGRGQSNSVTLNTFNNNMASGVSNNFENSVTLGTNFVLNSDGRNQRVGYAGFKSGKVDFSFYNDVIPVLGDQDDRWWTGGGSLNIGDISLKADVFTGIRDKSTSYINPDYGTIWDPTPGNPANGIHGTYQQTLFEKSFNNGQTIWGFRSWGAVYSGKGHMYPQSTIHNYMSDNLLFESHAKQSSSIYISTK
jgi:hypothetical protein